ncbi:MAG: helix-turn-helix domain-containing protein [Pseudonocardiaceae bacterium]
MTPKRQGLSQRRKAVGLTQESLAQRLGVERSTVVRWEAGDTEPLPSMRPNLARVLQVSMDQLAELLTESENADATQAPSAGAEVTIPMRLPEVQPKVQPGLVELEDLIPQLAGTIEALRRALRSAGVAPEDLNAMLIAQTEVSHRPSLTAIPLDVEPAGIQRAQGRSRRFTRLAAAGALALTFAAGSTSAPFITSYGGLSPSATAGNPAAAIPVGTPPVSEPGSLNGSTRGIKDPTTAVPAAPATAPMKPAGDPATPEAAVVPAPHTTQAASDSPTASRSKPHASTTPALPRTPAIPAEAATWSHKAALSASDPLRWLR